MQFHWHSVKHLIDVLRCHSLFPLAALILLSLSSPRRCYLSVHYLSATLDYKVREERQLISFVHHGIPGAYSYCDIVGAQKNI